MSVYDVGGDSLGACYHPNGLTLDFAYAEDGSVVFQGGYIPDLDLLNTRLMSSLNTSIITPQGFTMYNGYWFQFFSNENRLRVFRLSDYELVGTYDATNIRHANVMQFGEIEQDTGFPFLFVSEWGESESVDSKQIDKLKVSLSGYEIVDSYTLPASVGYHPNQIIDWQTETAYVVGYANSLSTSSTQPNIITALRLSDLSIIEQYQVPYLGVANGIEFYDGKILFYGNGWNSPQMKLSIIDTSTHNIIEYYFDKTTNEEFEDCAVYDGWLYLSNWVYDSTDGNKLKYRLFKMNLF